MARLRRKEEGDRPQPRSGEGGAPAGDRFCQPRGAGPPRHFFLSFLRFSIVTNYCTYTLYLLTITKATTNIVERCENVPQKPRFSPNAGFAIRPSPPILMRWPCPRCATTARGLAGSQNEPKSWRAPGSLPPRLQGTLRQAQDLSPDACRRLAYSPCAGVGPVDPEEPNPLHGASRTSARTTTRQGTTVWHSLATWGARRSHRPKPFSPIEPQVTKKFIPRIPR